jgi:hypothetical protein
MQSPIRLLKFALIRAARFIINWTPTKKSREGLNQVTELSSITRSSFLSNCLQIAFVAILLWLVHCNGEAHHHNRYLWLRGTTASNKSFEWSRKKFLSISPFKCQKKKKLTDYAVVDNTSPDIKGPTILVVLLMHPVRVLYSPIMHIVLIYSSIIFVGAFIRKYNSFKKNIFI